MMVGAGSVGGGGAQSSVVRGAGLEELRKLAASKRATKAATPIRSALVRGPVASGRRSGPVSRKVGVPGQDLISRLTMAKRMPVPGQGAGLEGADLRSLTEPTKAVALRAAIPIKSALVRQRRSGGGGGHDLGGGPMAARSDGSSAPQSPFIRAKATAPPREVPGDGGVAGLQKAMAAWRQSALKAAVPAKSALVRRRARANLGPRTPKSGSDVDLTEVLGHPPGRTGR
jgi:hypothetical protein